jgi:glycerophosphoryl diester phosphodiesterase
VLREDRQCLAHDRIRTGRRRVGAEASDGHTYQRGGFALTLAAVLALMFASSPSHALDLQGHRGARGLLPENTLPAFERALEAGMTTLELDCGVTREGIVVISHDRVLNPDLTRDENGRWLEKAGPAIWRLSYSEIQRYDVGRLKPGSEYAKRFPRQQPMDGTRIPRLADLFQLVRERANETVRFNIETKISPEAADETTTPEAFVRALLAVIRDARMESRVSIQSFDWRTLQQVQKDAPGIATAYLTAQKTSPRNIASGTRSAWSGFDLDEFGGSVPRMVEAAGGAIWSPYHADLTQAAVREAHSLGLKVVPWTVNSEADMRRFMSWGVDGLISDYPDALARIAKAQSPK